MITTDKTVTDPCCSAHTPTKQQEKCLLCGIYFNDSENDIRNVFCKHSSAKIPQGRSINKHFNITNLTAHLKVSEFMKNKSCQ